MPNKGAALFLHLIVRTLYVCPGTNESFCIYHLFLFITLVSFLKIRVYCQYDFVVIYKIYIKLKENIKFSPPPHIFGNLYRQKQKNSPLFICYDWSQVITNVFTDGR